jgi:hypothetical protein
MTFLLLPAELTYSYSVSSAHVPGKTKAQIQMEFPNRVNQKLILWHLTWPRQWNLLPGLFSIWFPLISHFLSVELNEIYFFNFTPHQTKSVTRRNRLATYHYILVSCLHLATQSDIIPLHSVCMMSHFHFLSIHHHQSITRNLTLRVI